MEVSIKAHDWRLVPRIDAAGVPRGSLKVENAESQALDQELVAKAIARCHRHGIGVALDDFGTGYSHLTQIHRLGFDTIRLDQAFSRSMRVASSRLGPRVCSPEPTSAETTA